MIKNSGFFAQYFIVFFVFNIYLTAQYQIKSPYLIQPQKMTGYVDSCASFWFKSYDISKGGFYTNVDRQGNLISEWGRNKNMLTQSRNAYGMVRAFMMTGNNDYLVKAKQALDFMYGSAWDNTNGGWFGNVSESGSADQQQDKTAFDQHYALLGILAYYEATGDTTAFNWFKKGFENNENNLWDNSAEQFGYYDESNFNWSVKNNKSFNATVDAVTTHLINAFFLTGDVVYKEKLILIADNILNRLVSTMDQYKIGFVENFDTNWEWTDNTSSYNTRTIMGHVLKTGWVLGRIYQVIPNEEYLTAAEKLLNDVWTNGYDHVYGGPFKDYDRLTGNPIGYGLANSQFAKAWWQMEQAIVAGLQIYELTKNDTYLQMADESLDFFMKYFVDHTYGEIYADLYQNGSLIVDWNRHKGNGSKAGYHSIETGYYSYLYGNLFYNKKDVVLNYNFYPVEYERNIKVYPLSIADDKLKIKNVVFEGAEYTAYSSADKTINLPAGNGGKFIITFGTDETTIIADNKNIPHEFNLFQNYPNPFNPSTKIKFSVSEPGNVSLKIYDALGREIKELANNYYNAGNYEIDFSGDKLSSGIYFYSLISGNNIKTKKMILLK
ncbi:MAG: AGE family epimerase/isomerase [Bacteroidetes bacterium]|nr:AGE family epimerase/isomerase [Bacteroidota bacterium]